MRSIAHLEQHVATLEAEYQKLSDDSAKGENDGFTTQSFPQDRKREEREREREREERDRKRQGLQNCPEICRGLLSTSGSTDG